MISNFVVNAVPPVGAETVAPRVVRCLPVDAPCVVKRSWPVVRPKLEECEDSAPVCDCIVSQGGSVAGGTDVVEKTEFPESGESEDWMFVLLEAEVEE